MKYVKRVLDEKGGEEENDEDTADEKSKEMVGTIYQKSKIKIRK